MAHPKSFELATKLVELTPEGLDKVFYTNSGSEAVDTALKMAIAYHRARGEGQRTRLIGRERGYHGVNFRRHLGRRHRRQPQELRHHGLAASTTCVTPTT
jgi:adenosylmethionine-8-amino-7-oxononanoate aminotransferase